MKVDIFTTTALLGSYPTKEANNLAEKYSSIANAANQVSSWPESEKFCSNLVHRQDEEGNSRFDPPSFDDGRGPIGVFAMLDNNKVAHSILEECSKAFDSFVSTVKDTILAKSCHQDSSSATGESPVWDILRAPEKYHHISVCIFQEHPSLLNNTVDQQHWRPVDEPLQRKLEMNLVNHLTQHCPCPLLMLDSLLWTPDGAMIAGFVDISEEYHYGCVQSSSADIARATIGGELTSRPKSLIHVTIGRVLQKAGDTSQNQALTDLMKHYNQKVFPALVESIRTDESKHKGCFEMEEISLGRNIVWPGIVYDTYATWQLPSTQP